MADLITDPPPESQLRSPSRNSDPGTIDPPKPFDPFGGPVLTAESQLRSEPATPESQLRSGPDNATARLRAFEDETCGVDAVRIHGHIERGSGSHYQTKLTHEQRMQHVALQKLIEAEQKVSETSVALATARVAHEDAKLVVEHATRAADAKTKRGAPPPPSQAGNWDGPTIKDYVAAGYSAKTYPPAGYAARSTPEEIASAVAEEKKADDKRIADDKAADEKLKSEQEQKRKSETSSGSKLNA